MGVGAFFGFAVAVLLGAGFIVLASRSLSGIRATRRGGVRTQGWVIDNRLDTDSDGKAYTPVIRFNTQAGRVVEFVADLYTPSPYEVGKQVPIVYQPSKPEQAILDTALEWLIPTLFLVVGVVVFLVGFIGFGAGLIVLRWTAGSSPPPQQTPATLVITQWVKDPAVVDGPWPGYRPQISTMQPKMVARVVAIPRRQDVPLLPAILDPDAGPTPDANGLVWVVEIRLNSEGTRLYGALTKNAVAACSSDCPERHITWWLDLSQDDIDHWNERAGADYRRLDQGGKRIFDPRVHGPITNGTFLVGIYTNQEAHILVQRLGGR